MEAAQQSKVMARLLCRSLLAAVVVLFTVVTVSAVFSSQVYAQERPKRWFSLRELFAPRRQDPPPRVLRDPSELPRVKEQRARRAAAAAKTPTAASEPEATVAEKAPDARIVLVLGDFVGSGFAQGLAAAYAENPNVVVIDRTRASTGLVRDDVYDWPAEIGAVIDKEKPAAIVLLLGSNDRQQMRVGGERAAVRSANWIGEYERRAKALTDAVTSATAKAPLLWVGTPPYKSAKMSEDMLAFNEIYRATATAASAEFIDIWDGFIDESGGFVASGPDINGQPVRLRTNDGINFTAAGKRKLAFYAEKPLAKALGLSSTPGSSGLSTLPDVPIDPKSPMPTDRTLPMSLDDPDLDGGTELLGANPLADRSMTAGVGRRAATDGQATAGRADDFSWPPRLAAPAETPVAGSEAAAATP